MSTKKALLVKLLPLVIIAFVIAVIGYMFLSKPEPRKRPQFEKPVVVEVEKVTVKPFQVFIESYGNIEAQTTGNLVAQVSGIVASVSDSLETGGSFSKGDLLATIDDKDYRIEVTIAHAELANSQLTLQQEQALAEQAQRDWNKINPNKKATSLVLRHPQVASAKAKLDAASARLAKAELALKRTKVIAPYDGRVIKKLSDLGQLVNSNSPIATILSTSRLEIRLPIATNKVQFLPDFSKTNDYPVELVADFGGFKKSWQAKLDRADSVIDQSSRQWFVTATLDGRLMESDPLLKVGQFVNATINGKTIEDAVVIPSKYIYDNQLVYLYQDGILMRKTVEVSWQGNNLSLIKEGLNGGEQLITTPLNFIADGAKLQIKGQNTKRKASKNKIQSPAKEAGAES